MQTMNAMIKGITLLKKLADEEEKTYGINHNDANEDFIIDAVDYGIGGCSFEEYKRLMEIAKEANK